MQADAIVPEPGNPQALNRYAYVLNNPAKYVDEDGHIHWLAAALVGGVVNTAVDWFVTTHIEHHEYSWKRGLVAFSTGALSGVTGVGLAKVATDASRVFASPAVAAVVEQGIKMGGNALANATLNTAQRALNGEGTSTQDLKWDVIFGAASSVMGDLADASVNHVAGPKMARVEIGNLRYPEIHDGGTRVPLRAPVSSPMRDMVRGGLSALGLALSDASFLELTFMQWRGLLNRDTHILHQVVGHMPEAY